MQDLAKDDIITKWQGSSQEAAPALPLGGKNVASLRDAQPWPQEEGVLTRRTEGIGAPGLLESSEGRRRGVC